MRYYADSREQLEMTGETPFNDRRFRLLLLSGRPAFDPSHTSVADVLTDPEVGRAGDVSIRTQTIANPYRPFGTGKIVQFFEESSSRYNHMVDLAGLFGVVYRQLANGTESLVAFLDPAEVNALMRGEGVAADINGLSVVTLTQAEYDAIEAPDPTTLYVIS